MSLHTAGHRRGVVAAPHHAAAETGRLILEEGGNALEAMVADGGDDRGGLSAHEPHRRRRLLAGARAIGPRARAHGRGAGGREGDAGALSRAWPRRDPAARAARGAHRAGRDRRLDAGAARPPSASAAGCRSTCCSAPAIRHAREGYVVTRSQARLTAEKLAECKDAPGFAATFLLDGKPPAEGATLKQTALAATLDQLANAGLDGLLSRRCRARDRRRSRTHRLAGDARRPRSAIRRASPSRCRVTLQAGTLYNTPPPTQGLASLMILALFERLRVTRSRELRSRARAGRGDQARVPRARPLRHRSGAAAASARALSGKGIPRRRGREDRPPQGGALAGAAGRGRHDLDGRGGFLRPRRLLHPVALLGVRLRPACCRAPAC